MHMKYSLTKQKDASTMKEEKILGVAIARTTIPKIIPSFDDSNRQLCPNRLPYIPMLSKSWF
eukprot:JP439804.1.p3 GENE.JP439804.1~~JP439804.1.p3  ORF type:complete len:62 (+),score=4.90 JP439804.1:188-373(+)